MRKLIVYLLVILKSIYILSILTFLINDLSEFIFNWNGLKTSVYGISLYEGMKIFEFSTYV